MGIKLDDFEKTIVEKIRENPCITTAELSRLLPEPAIGKDTRVLAMSRRLGDLAKKVGSNWGKLPETRNKRLLAKVDELGLLQAKA